MKGQSKSAIVGDTLMESKQKKQTELQKREINVALVRVI